MGRGGFLHTPTHREDTVHFLCELQLQLGRDKLLGEVVLFYQLQVLSVDVLLFVLFLKICV